MLLHQEMDISNIPLVRRELLLFLVFLEMLKFLLLREEGEQVDIDVLVVVLVV